MTDEHNTEDVLRLELTPRQRRRFEEIKRECADGLPEPADEDIFKSLLDTWDAVADGHYSED